MVEAVPGVKNCWSSRTGKGVVAGAWGLQVVVLGQVEQWWWQGVVVPLWEGAGQTLGRGGPGH